MNTKVIRDVSDFLGESDRRYFSDGFKYFNYKYENLFYYNQEFTGNLKTEYSWQNKNKRHLHLGTTEFIAISSTICEQIIMTEFNLTPSQISFSWISSFQIKIKSCINLKNNKTIPISGKLVSTEKDINTDYGYRSTIEVRVCNTIIKLQVCHSISFFIRGLKGLDIQINNSGLYQTGYKMRSHSIRDLQIKDTQLECHSSVSIRDFYYNRSGLGSAYRGTLLTDFILISGQLVQTLFFNLEKTDREKANNIWLIDFYITIDQPNNGMEYKAKLLFENIKTLKKGDEVWKCVQFKSELDGMKAEIKMATQVD